MTPRGGEPWNFQSVWPGLYIYGVNTTQAALGSLALVASRGMPTRSGFLWRLRGNRRAGETVFTKVRRPLRGM